MNSRSLGLALEKEKGKLDDLGRDTRSLDGKAGFGCVIFAVLGRSLGLDTCPNNDNRIALTFHFSKDESVPKGESEPSESE
jgi:hypothetical protein